MDNAMILRDVSYIVTLWEDGNMTAESAMLALAECLEKYDVQQERRD